MLWRDGATGTSQLPKILFQCEVDIVDEPAKAVRCPLSVFSCVAPRHRADVAFQLQSENWLDVRNAVTHLQRKDCRLAGSWRYTTLTPWQPVTSVYRTATPCKEWLPAHSAASQHQHVVPAIFCLCSAEQEARSLFVVQGNLVPHGIYSSTQVLDSTCPVSNFLFFLLDLKNKLHRIGQTSARLQFQLESLQPRSSAAQEEVVPRSFLFSRTHALILTQSSAPEV